MKIAIDIGHARGTGASGHGLQEHEVCAVIGGHLQRELETDGHEVVVLDFPDMSNRDDLNATIRAANEGKFDFGLSLHCDCSGSGKAHGAHACYYSSGGRKLASAIAKPLTALLPGRAHAVQCRTDLAMLRRTRPRWSLLELGFIDNVSDARMQRYAPEKIARAVAEGVREYIKLVG